MRVLAAMSGGVDSAVAAARMVDAGHDVVGVHLALASAPQAVRSGSRGCCSLEDSRDARRAADTLGIPFYVWDVAEEFRESVVEDFLAEYAQGRTPNPCIRCNERIKFAAVLDRARALGFDAVATGHYARFDGSVLRRARDEAKDQSYVLATLASERLADARFPLGDSVKAEVRAEAARRGLAVARKPDSYDVCFIPDGDTRAFLVRALGEAPGRIVDAESGEDLGPHTGTHTFTVGQRRGLGVGRPSGDGRPRYVLSLEPLSRTVRVGPREALDVWSIEADDVVWHVPARVGAGVGAGAADGAAARGVGAAAVGDSGGPYLVQYRAHGERLPCTVQPVGPAGTRAGAPVGTGAGGPVGAGDGTPAGTPSGERLRVRLGAPASGVAPGQAVVVYEGDRVVVAGRVGAAAR